MPLITRSQFGGLMAAVLALTVACSMFAGVGAASGVTYVTVSDVAVSDDNPTTGDLVTITPTIRHSSAGDAGFQINEVTLTNSNGERIAEANDLGTIGGSETLDVPLRVSFDSAGDKHLTLHVRGVTVNNSGDYQLASEVTYPVYIDVDGPAADEPEPRVHIDAAPMVAGDDSTVDVTVSNGGEDSLSDVTLQLSGDGIATKTQMQPTISAESMQTFTFSVTPSETGSADLTASLSSSDVSTSTTSSVPVSAVDDDVRIDATVVENDNTTLLQYHVANAGNAPIEDVLVTADSPDVSLPSASVERVAASSSETVAVPIGNVPSEATIDVSYTVAGESSSATTTVSGESLQTNTLSASGSTGQEAFLGGGMGGVSLGAIALLFGGVVVGGVAGTRLRK
ncbi:putative membrane protein [Halarchaeum rubridurum]|uniref:Putative membrane protein n=1 Tax=Halarchaeum rubridurum TaxID=489911 RepID=A0A830G1D0_9EURY|nr:CARDB domain-containing protein [Halarchaeum rubridurum]MBP1954984.1 putative membrane protein [Halarchaeum rubridurum]GGM69936.1 hypothetical protein GCM10009017_20080 [Halarchaeum rubridurum]